MKKTIPFHIKHVDPMGQGVSKLTDNVVFIPKTLPGEDGVAHIVAQTKKTAFATTTVDQITLKSPERIFPYCPHYEICSGCHYQHTNYENEITFKKNGLSWLLKNVCKKNPIQIEVHESPKRNEYRNRIQLHYDSFGKQLGFISRITGGIIEVPRCTLALPQIQMEIRQLYENGDRSSIFSDERAKGHLEIIIQDDQKVHRYFNSNYSHGGFTQVNSLMNKKLQELVKDKYDFYLQKHGTPSVLDLFGGNGNLSRNLTSKSTAVIDIYRDNHFIEGEQQTFIDINLYSKNFLSKLSDMVSSADFLLLDPPRSGFKGISDLVNKYDPSLIFYVSCNPATLARDIQSIMPKYDLLEVHLLDFFPSTYHFETLCILGAGYK
ncbi:MAG: class I SAM-dependent RNA methyltransferase [Bacteriovoracaceae bacterium]|nr:class I SAM-dependent RNA methyltransferase [Bacteriovoracaceae bacterium]